MTLSDFRKRRHWHAGNGGNGKGKQKHGRKGRDINLKVPLGTVVRSVEDGKYIMLGDITKQGQRLQVAKGGRGGLGNRHFTTSRRQAPKIATEGETGEGKRIILDLKLLTDVGLVGLPNAGKSTLINAVSAVKSEVASYPFTTLETKLGVVEVGYQSFVMADIPGLVKGAHSGAGLGHDFLRHVERTRILIHIIDGNSGSPISDFSKINEELSLFNPSLGDKPQIIAVNKLDLPSVRQRMAETERLFSVTHRDICFISAVTGEGVSDLIKKTMELLAKEGAPKQITSNTDYKIFRPRAVNK